MNNELAAVAAFLEQQGTAIFAFTDPVTATRSLLRHFRGRAITPGGG